MDIEKINKKEIDEIIAKTGFDYDLLVKDYYLTLILFLIKNIKGLYFKGGTALQKTLIEYSRISEDIDFTLDQPLNKVKSQIITKINDSKLFGKITQDKDVEGFTRLIVPYKTDLGIDKIFIDLNQRATLLLKSEQLKMSHFYSNIPQFTFPCLNRKEMIAEKVAAAIGRNKPRDHYDIYQIIKHNLNIDMKLVKQKCKQSNQDSSILKMFNKAKKLHKKWDKDMIPLLKEFYSRIPVLFQDLYDKYIKEVKNE
jgi:predicted nucleotidyltransferase component of viral defense system